MALGKSAPVEPQNKQLTSYAVATVGVVAAAAASYQVKRKRDSVAVVDLYNRIVDLDEPCELSSETVTDIGKKFGVNLMKEELDGVKRVYGQYLESMIPLGDVQLRGDEAEKVKLFKEALGLSDEDAAPVHIDVGRRLSRQGFEIKDRQSQFNAQRAFQRLIYVSFLVFGDQKAAFLLPWRHVFNLTDAQLFVARRDNAKAIFRQYMQSHGDDLPADRHFLRQLRDTQVALKMMDESAEELIKEYARRHVEKHLSKAMEVMRTPSRTRQLMPAIEELQAVIEYNRRMVKYSSEEDLIPGLGNVVMTGTSLGGDGKARELRDLYRMYLDEQLTKKGEFDAALEADCKELQAVMALSAKEAGVIQDEVAAKLYRKLLKDETSSGRIDAAASPAQVLQALCERCKFSPEAAFEFHKSLYRQQVTALISKGKVTDEDEAKLKRIRRILCISNDTAKKVQKETAGKLLAEVLDDVYAGGVKPLTSYDAERVEKVVKDLRMDSDVAMEILATVTRERFRSYVKLAQKEGDKKDAALRYKKLVQFNAVVVTPIYEKIKGLDAAQKELADLLKEAVKKAGVEEAAEAAAAPSSSSEAGADSPLQEAPAKELQDVKKAIMATRGEFGDEERKGQREISLRDDLEVAARAEIYKNYLMHTMQSDVVELPVGGMIRRRTSEAERAAEMSRLQALGDLLGMSGAEVSAVHGDLSEQAFRVQAQDLFRTGDFNEEKAQQLEGMRQQLGLAKDRADTILKSVRTQVLGSAMGGAGADDGKYRVEQLVQMSRNNIPTEGLVEEATRRNMFRKEIETKVTDGTGDFDASYLLGELPKALALDQRRVDMIVKELVASRKRMLLVQAVSQLRQKRVSEALLSLQNLVSCFRAIPEEKPLPWTEHDELQQLYSLYYGQERDSTKLAVLQGALGINHEEAATVQGGAMAGEKGAAGKGDDDESFF